MTHCPYFYKVIPKLETIKKGRKKKKKKNKKRTIFTHLSRYFIYLYWWVSHIMKKQGWGFVGAGGGGGGWGAWPHYEEAGVGICGCGGWGGGRPKKCRCINQLFFGLDPMIVNVWRRSLRAVHTEARRALISLLKSFTLSRPVLEPWPLVLQANASSNCPLTSAHRR